MASNADMSLDDIIAKKKISTRGNRRGGGRGGGRGGMRGIGRGGRARGRGTGISTRGRGGFRSPSNFRSPRGSGNINGRWSHDMYYGGASAVRSMSNGSKLNITNLDFGVSDSDIKELFSEFGNMRAASVHYDRTGRSLGTAHVIFERRTDALKAIKQYNGVHLDGRPMNIEIDGGAVGGGIVRGSGGMGRGRMSSMNGVRGSRVKRLQGGPRPIGGGGGSVGGGSRIRGRGGSRGRTMRGGARGRGGRGRGRGTKKVPTAEELDAELDAYSFEATSK